MEARRAISGFKHLLLKQKKSFVESIKALRALQCPPELLTEVAESYTFHLAIERYDETIDMTGTQICAFLEKAGVPSKLDPAVNITDLSMLISKNLRAVHIAVSALGTKDPVTTLRRSLTTNPSSEELKNLIRLATNRKSFLTPESEQFPYPKAESSPRFNNYQDDSDERPDNHKQSLAYRSRLSEEGWSADAINDLNEQANKILIRCRHINEVDALGGPTIPHKGLVIGKVQSGKTANYALLAAKAVDYGYTIVIVLTSNWESLRRQTQRRLEKDLGATANIFWTKATERGIELDTNGRETAEFRDGDYGGNGRVFRQIPVHGAGTTYLAIIKKNKSRLGRLVSDLAGAAKDSTGATTFSRDFIAKHRVLIIDDEADQLSVSITRKIKPRRAGDHSRAEEIAIEAWQELRIAASQATLGADFATEDAPEIAQVGRMKTAVLRRLAELEQADENEVKAEKLEQCFENWIIALQELRHFEIAELRGHEDEESIDKIIRLQKEQAMLSQYLDSSFGTGATAQKLSELFKFVPNLCYVGFTATPAAIAMSEPGPGTNFPSNFILTIEPGAGHQGPFEIAGFSTKSISGGNDSSATFGGDDEDDGADHVDLDATHDPASGSFIRIVHDSEAAKLVPQGKKTPFRPEPRPVLRRALYYFLFATAQRWARSGWTPEETNLRGRPISSFMLHTTALASHHNELRKVLTTIISELKSETSDYLANGKKGMGAQLKAAVGIWDHEADTCRRVNSTLYPNRQTANGVDLIPIVSDVLRHSSDTVTSQPRVIVENGSEPMDRRLDYEEPKQRVFVVVGGILLSRGLTLEGLTVSFFLRNAPHMTALQQMGRWFGYRPGYEDLQRVWTSQDLREEMIYIAAQERALYEQVEEMLRFQRPPHSIRDAIFSSPNLKPAGHLFGFSRQGIDFGASSSAFETTLFDVSKSDAINGNTEATESLLNQLSEKKLRDEGSAVSRNVPFGLVRTFFEGYTFFDPSQINFLDYVKKHYASDNWSVAIITGDGPSHTTKIAGFLSINTVLRRKINDSGIADIKGLVWQKDTAVDMPEDAQKEIKEAGGNGWRTSRKLRTQLELGPILLLYPIFENAPPTKNRKPIGPSQRIIWGIGIHFPWTSANAGTSELEWYKQSLDIYGPKEI